MDTCIPSCSWWFIARPYSALEHRYVHLPFGHCAEPTQWVYHAVAECHRTSGCVDHGGCPGHHSLGPAKLVLALHNGRLDNVHLRYEGRAFRLYDHGTLVRIDQCAKRLADILLVLLFTWLLYSAWWCWWLGTSFGGRGFVDLYALLAIPLAWLFRSIFTRSISTRVVTGFLLTFLIFLNFGLMERFNWEWSKEDWTWQLFFKEVSGILGGR